MNIMKKLVLILGVAVSLAACKSKIKQDDLHKNMVLVDTTGLYKSNALTDVGDKFVLTDKTVNPASKSENKTTASPENKATSSTGNGNTTVVNNTKTPRDKGWSDAAKGTAIGGGSGAIVGAVVSKDKVKGSVIGAVIGAGAGYAIGRSSDRKSGRVARAKARRSGN